MNSDFKGHDQLIYLLEQVQKTVIEEDKKNEKSEFKGHDHLIYLLKQAQTILSKADKKKNSINFIYKALFTQLIRELNKVNENELKEYE